MTRFRVLFIGLLNAVMFWGAIAVGAEPLIVGFGEHNSPPYTMIQEHVLIGGIYKDLMDELGKRLGIEVVYKFTAKKRQEEELLSGKLHVLVLTNSAWQQHADQYAWSIPLLEESMIFVTAAQAAFPITTLDDLSGKRVGTLLGFVYPELTEKFERQETFRDDVVTLEQNFKKLAVGRIDCLIGSNVLIGYYLKINNARNQFVIAEKVLSRTELSSAFSPRAPVAIEDVNRVYQQLKDDGTLDRIFEQYR